MIKKLENIWWSRFLLRNLRCVKSAMNVKGKKAFLEGTDYKFDESVRKLRIPYTPVTEA